MEPKYLFLLICLFRGISGKCVWYGQCFNISGTYKINNCLYEGEPKPFVEDEEKEAMKILQEKCPFLLKKYPGKNFCCDLKMLKTMAVGLKLAEDNFGRCSTCIHNWFQHVCEFNCSPNQDMFMEPVKTAVNGKNETYIVEIDIYMTERYKESTFMSCKDVLLPSTGEKAITIACNFDKYCTPKKWFNAMGDVKIYVVPFQINYIQPRNESKKALDIPTLPCNESYVGDVACSCADCQASCNIPFENPGKSSLCDLFDFFTYFTLALLAILVLSALVFFIFGWKSRNHRKSERLDKIGDRIHLYLENFFTECGIKCANHTILVPLILCSAVVGLVYGAFKLEITTDPVQIWAASNSQSRTEKDYFETKFAPFYRTNQIFINTKNLTSINWSDGKENVTFGPIFHKEFLRTVYDLQMKIQNITTDEGVQLKDICFAPMRTSYTKELSEDQCTVQSIWGYVKNDIELLNNTEEFRLTMMNCLSNNFDFECLAPFGGPIFSRLAVVGFKEIELNVDGINFTDYSYHSATGVVLTFLLDNPLNKTKLTPALEWEKKYIELVKKWSENEKPDFIEVAFSAERSVQDEIERESNGEIGTVVFSYLIMFVYITIALGKVRRISTLLVDSRIMLGIGGIVIVIASVLSSLGVFGYLQVPTTLLTIEVIPFLVLAVGVDNIFILVHTVQHMKNEKEMAVDELIGRSLGKIGPSILLTSLSEASCFFIGSLSNMPAVKTFALYSSVAVILNFVFQITVFVSYLAIDLRRVEAGRLDVLCCLKTSKKSRGDEGETEFLFNLFKNYYGPFLMKRRVRVAVVAVFVCWLAASAYFTTQIELGLEQELSMPQDSYLIDYFRNLRDLLTIGPPVYFVIKEGLNYTNGSHVNAVCGTKGCNSDSFITYLSRASELENMTYLVKSPSSWLDDYFAWLDTVDCCKKFENGSYCPEEFRNYCDDCQVEMVNGLRPNAKDFKKYLTFFLTDIPSITCSKAGRAAYGEAVNFVRENDDEVTVTDSYFMGYHTVLKTSQDYYTALQRSRNIAERLSKDLTEKVKFPVEVFSYSVFYVFYEQYLTIVKDAISSLSLSLITVFAVTFVLTGLDFVSSFLVLVTVTSLLVNLMGLMYLWNVTLNAISLVNLIVSIGIGVEFCSHLVHSFATANTDDRISRALESISRIGSSVFSGITLTKFSGILVLAFAQSLIFRIYYFRMYFGMVLIGAAHGLILLPVLLSYFGPRVNQHRLNRLKEK